MEEEVAVEVSWRSFCQSDVRIPNFLTWQESYTYTLWAKKFGKKCNYFWDDFTNILPIISRHFTNCLADIIGIFIALFSYF